MVDKTFAHAGARFSLTHCYLGKKQFTTNAVIKESFPSDIPKQHLLVPKSHQEETGGVCISVLDQYIDTRKDEQQRFK